MSREELKQSGVLDQYVLGLLDPERSEMVERLMEEDPLLEAEVRRLRRELNSYADARNILPPDDGRAPRTAQDFQDLDHEMITAMMERNHTLNIWRYVLIGACLLLIGLSGFLFRLKENVRGELVTERALHAQDERSYQHDLNRQQTVLMQSLGAHEQLRLVEQRVDTGMVRLHIVENAGIGLLDLTRLPPLQQDTAYLVYGMEESPRTVSAGQQIQLTVIRLPVPGERLQIYRWPMEHVVPPTPPKDPLVTLEVPPVD